MPIETPINSIADLDELSPSGSETRKEGDDHLRLIKDAIKKTFANIAGSTDVTETELDYLAGVIAGAAQADKALVLDSSGDLLSGINNFIIDGNLTVKGLEVLLESANSILKANGSAEFAKTSSGILFNKRSNRFVSRITWSDGGPNDPDFNIRLGHYVNGTTESATRDGDAAILIKGSHERTRGKLVLKVARYSASADDAIVWSRSLVLEADRKLQVDNGNGLVDIATSETVGATKSDYFSGTTTANSPTWRNAATLTFSRKHAGNIVLTVTYTIECPSGTAAANIRMRRPNNTTFGLRDIALSGNRPEAHTVQFLDEAAADGTYTFQVNTGSGYVAYFRDVIISAQELD